MGRTAVPMEQRKVEGTVRSRHRRKAAEVGAVLATVEVKLVENLPDLSAEAKKHWPFLRNALQKLPVSCESDVPALQLLAETYATWKKLCAVVAKEGSFYETFGESGKIIRAHPALSERNDAERRLRILLTDFGLTPASRTRVKGTDDGNAPKDPLAEFGV